MNLSGVINIIKEFWNERDADYCDNVFFIGGKQNELDRIQPLFEKALPLELIRYIKDVVPYKHMCFSNIGNDICLYGVTHLSNKVNGYSFNPLTGENIEDWNPNWFIIGDEGGDPIIVDLNLAEQNEQCSVYQAIHGCGEWNFREISSSISQFILCIACLHHALVGFDVGESIIDDEDELFLNNEIAEWLLPRIKEYDPVHYEDWVGIFKNS